jgi:hypothetical protein
MFHLTEDTIDGERYLDRDEAEARLCKIITDIGLAERYWDGLRRIAPGLQVAASVYHPQIGSKLWESLPHSLKRTAIASE